MTSTNHDEAFPLTDIDDILYDDQSAQLTRRVICDDRPPRAIFQSKTANASNSSRSSETSRKISTLRQNDLSPTILENTPLLTKRAQRLAINEAPSFYISKVAENVGKSPNYVSIVDYETTTTTTTTKTKLTPRLNKKSPRIEILPKNLQNTRNFGVIGNDLEIVNRVNVVKHHPHYLMSEASSDNDEEDEDESSLSKPLLLVLQRYNHEGVKTNTGTLAKARVPLFYSEITPNKSSSNNNYHSHDESENFQQKNILKPPQKQQTIVNLATAKAAKSVGDGERDTWENKTDFLLSVIGFAVDLANVWRFPYLCFKNGGGAFLIPYVLMVVLAGIPLFYMELALGQYYRKGAITTWGKICPLFKGIGYCVIMTAFYTDFFYNVIIAFALHYFFASFTTVLPWTSCSNSYNSPACYEPSWSSDSNSRECASAPVFINSTALNSSFRAVSAAEEYFYKYLLGLHAEKEPIAHVAQSLSNLGSINWELVACVMVVYLICYFSLWKGIKMSGKVVWFTAIFPYIVLGVLLVRGVTLPGWEKGIEYYLRPNLEMLKMPSVWQDAATQVFFSLGPGFGVLLAYSSYNEFHNNVYFDALLTSSINCMTSFLAGFVIFSILGYMSCKSGKPIHEVAQEGPGLAFVVYPEALATMPGASLWSIAFFLMLLTLGLDSSFGGSEAIITGLGDEFPIIRRNREIFVAILFVFYMIVGTTMCTRGGMLVMEWLIFYGTAWGLLIAVFCETMVISFCYGIKQFSEDIREMLGFAPGWYWKICWTIGAPSFLIAMIMSSFINYQSLQYQDYVYSPTANMFGLLFALSSASAIPIVGIYTLYKQPGETCLEKLRLSLIPLKRRRSSTATITIPVANTSHTVAPTVVINYANRCGNDAFLSYPHSNDIML